MSKLNIKQIKEFISRIELIEDWDYKTAEEAVEIIRHSKITRTEAKIYLATILRQARKSGHEEALEKIRTVLHVEKKT